MAPLKSHRMDYYNGNQKMKEYDFSSGNPDHKRFAMIIRDVERTCKVILELDDALGKYHEKFCSEQSFFGLT